LALLQTNLSSLPATRNNLALRPTSGLGGISPRQSRLSREVSKVKVKRARIWIESNKGGCVRCLAMLLVSHCQVRAVLSLILLLALCGTVVLWHARSSLRRGSVLLEGHSSSPSTEDQKNRGRITAEERTELQEVAHLRRTHMVRCSWRNAPVRLMFCKSDFCMCVAQAFKAAEARLSALKLARRAIGSEIMEAESDSASLLGSLEREVHQAELDVHGPKSIAPGNTTLQPAVTDDSGSAELQPTYEGRSAGIAIRRFPPLPHWRPRVSRHVPTDDLARLILRLRRSTEAQGAQLRRAEETAGWGGELPALGLSGDAADWSGARVHGSAESQQGIAYFKRQRAVSGRLVAQAGRPGAQEELMDTDRGNGQRRAVQAVEDREAGLGVFLCPRLGENFGRLLLGVCYPTLRERAQLAAWRVCHDCKDALGPDVVSLGDEARCARYQPRDAADDS